MANHIKTITVMAAKSQGALERYGADVENSHYETVNSAINAAKRYLTEEYRLMTESSERLGYSQVLVNGEVIHDFFGK